MSTVTVTRNTLPADRYVIVSNEMARGRYPVPLHALARCILLYLLSLPTTWRMDRDQLDTAFLEGREAVSKALREMVAAGYLRRTRHQSGDQHRWSWTWEVTDDPITRPLTGFPSPENPSMGLTCGNTTKPQVGPINGISIDGKPVDNKKTEGKKTEEDGCAAEPHGSPTTSTPSLNQRINAVTKVYTDAQPLARFPAVQAIVKKALKADYDDEAVRAALLRLAKDKRSVTTETLRIELDGPPRTNGTHTPYRDPAPADYESEI